MISEDGGNYRELGPLAQGGMAVLTRAVDSDARPVVIKRIRPPFENDPTYRTLFFDEGAAVASVDHAAVVRLLDRGEDERGPFMVFEYVEGTDLGVVLDANREVPLPLQTVVCIAIPLFEALAAVHDATDAQGTPLGLVHRDISPGNVLLSCDGDVKLADFGVAAFALQTHQTVVGEMKGKYAYMAPEQTHGHSARASADLFAAGVLLWECLSGQRLFDAPTDADVVAAVRNRSPLALDVVNPKVPAALCVLVAKLLRKEADKRPPSAQQVVEALEEVALNLGLDRGRRRLVQQLARQHPRPTPDAESGSPGDSRRQTQRVIASAPAQNQAAKLWPVALLLFVVIALGFAFTFSKKDSGDAISRSSSLLIRSKETTTKRTIENTGKQTPSAPKQSELDAQQQTHPPPQPPTKKIHHRRQNGAHNKGTKDAAMPSEAVPSTKALPLNRVFRRRKPQGKLFLSSEPWAAVSIDGKSLGRNTPLLGLPLSVGKHQIHLVNPHYHLQKDIVITLAPEQEVRTFVDLTQ